MGGLYNPPDMGVLEDFRGTSAGGRAFTATLLVSPDGSGADGLTWASAYTTIQSALDACSTDANDCTLIMIAPHATFYNIDTTGNPTWSANVEIRGTHRIWAAVRNNHASATSVMNFTGKASLRDLAIFTTGTTDGVSFTSNGWRVRKCGFNSTGTTGATTSVHIDGSGGITRGGIMEDVQFLGHVTHTTAIHLEQSTINEFRHCHLHNCLVGLKITDSDSDENHFEDSDIGDSALAIDIDGGNEQHFTGITFHHNTVNIDDEVGDHVWTNIKGSFPITTIPDDFTGVTVATGDGADTWTAGWVEVRATADNVPFRITNISIEADASEKFRVKFYDGSTEFADVLVEGETAAARRSSFSFPSGTEFIFNKGTVISAKAKSESAGVDNVVVWLEIQEI